MELLFWILATLLLLFLAGLFYLRWTPHGWLTWETGYIRRRYGDSPTRDAEFSRHGMAMAAHLLNRKLEPIAELEDFFVPTDDYEIPVRLYRPVKEALLPVMIYAHGGGWVAGDINTHDNICRRLANTAGIAVLSVDYQLAPECPFPAALDDMQHVLEWVREQGLSVNCDPGRILVGGDSAGGNLAAVLTNKAAEKYPDLIKAQVLVYPITNVGALDTASYKKYATGYRLTRELMDFFRQAYTEKANWSRPTVSPLLEKHLSGLPPTLIILAQFDVLRDEGEAYGQKLQTAGVPTTIVEFKGVFHGFFGHTLMGKAGIKAIDAAADFVRPLVEEG